MLFFNYMKRLKDMVVAYLALSTDVLGYKHAIPGDLSCAGSPRY